MQTSYNILIVGGGIIGSSIAMALSEAGASKIAVVDCDLSGRWGSSERNAGGVRATWAQTVNIALAKHSIDFYESRATEVGFLQKGYLWLYDAAGWRHAAAHREAQKRQGCVIEALSPQDIARRFPFFDRLEGVYAAGFSPKDGLINPNLLKTYYRSHAAQGAVDWIDRHVVEAIELKGGAPCAVRLREIASEDATQSFLIDQSLPAKSRALRLKIDALVNAAGAWAPRVSSLYGRDLPSRALRRQVAIVACKGLDLSVYGMFVDTTGLYFHHEGGNILSGFAQPAEAPGYRFDYDQEAFFVQEIWPRLAARASVFDRLKPIGGWAGLYAVSPDNNAMIGPVDGLEHVYEAHSFSGHGVMQSYAVGRGLAEFILEGRYRTLDLFPLSGGRFKSGKTLPETLLI